MASDARRAKRLRQRTARQRRKQAASAESAPVEVMRELEAQADPQELGRAERSDWRPSAAFEVLEWCGASATDEIATASSGQLPNGEIGYYQQRFDDCFQKALATLLQVPPEQVPHPRIYEQLEQLAKRVDFKEGREFDAGCDRIALGVALELENWLVERGHEFLVSEDVPSFFDRERWIGIVEEPDRFRNHSLVMERSTVLWNPALALPVMPGMRVRPGGLDDVDYGIAVVPTQRKVK
jgi:hypothetical protein